MAKKTPTEEEIETYLNKIVENPEFRKECKLDFMDSVIMGKEMRVKVIERMKEIIKKAKL